MKKIANILIVLICLSFPFIAEAEFPHLPFGKSVTTAPSSEKIEIDHSFIKLMSKHPTMKLASENFWELIYFINLGDKEALNIGINLLTQNTHTDLLHDKYGLQYIARAVSQNDEFWYQLQEKKLDQITAVLAYFERFPDQYENMEGFEYMKNTILKTKH